MKSVIIFTGMLTLSPMSVAPVCHVGDPLNLTCMAFAEFQIEWSIRLVNEQGILKDIIAYSNSRDTSLQLT